MGSHDPSYRVVEAVAREEGVSPTDLSPPLYRVIDPEALDALFHADEARNAGHLEVEFTYGEYVVRVRNDPTVNVAVEEVTAPTASANAATEREAGAEE